MRDTILKIHSLIEPLIPFRLSGDSHWLPSDQNFFFKMAPYRIAVMNDDIGKFAYDNMQQRTKKDKNHEKDFTKNLYGKVCNVFVFYKNLLCHFRVHVYAMM